MTIMARRLHTINHLHEPHSVSTYLFHPIHMYTFIFTHPRLEREFDVRFRLLQDQELNDICITHQ